MKAFEQYSFGSQDLLSGLRLFAPALRAQDSDCLLTFLERYCESSDKSHIAELARRLRMLSIAQRQVLASAFSDFQLESKNWLVKELMRWTLSPVNTIFVLGGWVGVLPLLLFENGVFPDAKILSFDMDPACADIAETVCRPWVMQDWRFKASTANILDLNYHNTTFTTARRDGSLVSLSATPSLVINTICEHLPHFSKWLEMIPPGLPLVLQSNNMKDEPDHVNCVETLDEFIQQVQPFDITFAGELENGDRKRFLIIGTRK